MTRLQAESGVITVLGNRFCHCNSGTTLSWWLSKKKNENRLIFNSVPFLCHYAKDFQIGSPKGTFLSMKRRKIK